MGDRIYLPGLGRFAQTDSVEDDPITFQKGIALHKLRNILLTVGVAVLMAAQTAPSVGATTMSRVNSAKAAPVYTINVKMAKVALVGTTYDQAVDPLPLCRAAAAKWRNWSNGNIRFVCNSSVPNEDFTHMDSPMGTLPGQLARRLDFRAGTTYPGTTFTNNVLMYAAKHWENSTTFRPYTFINHKATVDVVTHELGHALALGHAGDGFQTLPYGDTWSIMGSGRSTPGIIQWEQLGQNAVSSLNGRSGTYTVGAVHNPVYRSGFKFTRNGSVFYLEYRATSSLGNGPGIVLTRYTADGHNVENLPIGSNGVALRVGQTYYGLGGSIKLVSSNSTQAVIQVNATGWF